MLNRSKVVRLVMTGLMAFAGINSGLSQDADSAVPTDLATGSIEVFPSTMTLTAPLDSRRIIVSHISADGVRRDVTDQAQVTTSSECLRIDGDGFVTPVASGQGSVHVDVAGQVLDVPVTVEMPERVPVDFIREVNPLMGKVGCNQGTCHGSASGKNGFKLSLRGYDPLYDYRALVDDISGRRFNRSEPAQSLMLLKPTQAVPHEGGFLFDEQSRSYRIIEQWIAEGCRYNAEAARVTGIQVYPQTVMLQQRGEHQQVIVIAEYSDGSTRDVTRDAVFDTSNFEVCTVTRSGQIEAVRRGEAAALIRFEGNYAAVPVSVLGNRDGFEWQPSPEYNQIDTLVNARLQKLKILPSGDATDAEFLRRVYLDITGVPPSVDAVRAFISDPTESRAKRSAVVEKLLNSSDYVEYWTLKWSDLLLARRQAITERGVWAFRNWIRQCIAEDRPYNEFVHELVTANGSTLDNPPANYFRIAREPKVVMENMTQVFLGTRFNCNQCHDHPFERWTQRQYYELAAYFADVGRKPLPDGDEIIFTRASPEAVVNPDSNQTASPSFPFQHAGPIDTAASRRMQLAQWLTAKENPYFARSIVNRYWSYFYGRGIIDPVDDIRAGNPPSNPELLDTLEADFVASGYSLKQLIRTMCNSATYQRTLDANFWNVEDKSNFSHALPRRLTAEQLYDSLIQATGAPRALPGVPPGFRAAQLPDPQVEISFLDMFGRAPRESPCECERNTDVSLGQTLNMINGPTISDAIAHPNGIIARSVAAGFSDEQLVETIYLSVLCRMPSDEERQKGVQYFQSVNNQQEASEDLMWALVNSPGFLFNR
ncbi:MAG: DUF1553 domain-containing protein [Planctomycetaceae bacterium]|nr:DUF1553 domain-containing protein [Planctomycetaceae bacterium]